MFSMQFLAFSLNQLIKKGLQYIAIPIKSYVLLTIEAYNTYHMGIIGFPTAFEHDTTKSSLWGQTLFEGPFKDFYDFTRYFRNIGGFKNIL